METQSLTEIFTPGVALNTPAVLINVVIKNAFMLAGLAALILLIFGGFQFIVGAGSGDTKKMEGSKKALTGAVAGLVIILTSVWIIQIIGTITGLDFLKTIGN